MRRPRDAGAACMTRTVWVVPRGRVCPRHAVLLVHGRRLLMVLLTVLVLEVLVLLMVLVLVVLVGEH